MTIPKANEETEKTLVNQPADESHEHHTTWPAPPLSPISSNPPPELSGLPTLRAPAMPVDLLDVQLLEDDSSE